MFSSDHEKLMSIIDKKTRNKILTKINVSMVFVSGQRNNYVLFIVCKWWLGKRLAGSSCRVTDPSNSHAFTLHDLSVSWRFSHGFSKPEGQWFSFESEITLANVGIEIVRCPSLVHFFFQPEPNSF